MTDEEKKKKEKLGIELVKPPTPRVTTLWTPLRVKKFYKSNPPARSIPLIKQLNLNDKEIMKLEIKEWGLLERREALKGKWGERAKAEKQVLNKQIWDVRSKKAQLAKISFRLDLILKEILPKNTYSKFIRATRPNFTLNTPRMEQKEMQKVNLEIRKKWAMEKIIPLRHAQITLKKPVKINDMVIDDVAQLKAINILRSKYDLKTGKMMKKGKYVYQSTIVQLTRPTIEQTLITDWNIIKADEKNPNVVYLNFLKNKYEIYIDLARKEKRENAKKLRLIKRRREQAIKKMGSMKKGSVANVYSINVEDFGMVFKSPNKQDAMRQFNTYKSLSESIFSPNFNKEITLLQNKRTILKEEKK